MLYLSDRYDVVGDMADLNEAVVLSRQALNLYPSVATLLMWTMFYQQHAGTPMARSTHWSS
jgi:hypothetical protein